MLSDDFIGSADHPLPAYWTTERMLWAWTCLATVVRNFDGWMQDASQYGFRQGRSTIHPLFILRRLQDYSSRTGTPFHCLFIDWKQAFDKLDHDSLLIALRRMGIHEQYITLIQDIYTSPTFHTIDIKGDKFTATPHTGIRQGCPLSPYLFIFVLSCVLMDVDDRLVRQGVPQNTWLVGKPTYDLEYADDTLLFGISVPALESYLQALQQEAQLYGLELNLTKTELLHPSFTPPPPNFLNGDQYPKQHQ